MMTDSNKDRTNIGNAKVAGMADDLHLSSNQYSTALVVFFVTYVVFEPPSNMILVRTRPSIYLPCIMCVWGVLTCCMAAIKDYHHLLVLRLLIGLFESGFAPGILLIISSWYKRTEQSTRFAVYISAAILSGAFGGLLAGAITGGLEGSHGIRGWRWLFIVEGGATICWAACAGFILLDFPGNSKSLTPRERAIAIARLRESEVKVLSEDQPKLGERESFKLACRNWRTWVFVVGYMVSIRACSALRWLTLDVQVIVGSSTLSYFYPTLVKGLGYTNVVKAQYMTVPIYAVAFVCTAVTGYLCDKAPGWRGLVIAAWLTVALITSIVVCTVSNFGVRYAMLIIMAAGLWASNALSLSFASSTFGSMSPETRAVALATVNGLGNLAQVGSSGERYKSARR